MMKHWGCFISKSDYKYKGHLKYWKLSKYQGQRENTMSRKNNSNLAIWIIPDSAKVKVRFLFLKIKH